MLDIIVFLMKFFWEGLLEFSPVVQMWSCADVKIWWLPFMREVCIILSNGTGTIRLRMSNNDGTGSLYEA